MFRRIAGLRCIQRCFGSDGVLRDSDLASLVKSRDRRKIARETFKTKADQRRRDREEMVMAMPFEQLTKELKTGQASYRDIEVDRISKEKINLENQVRQAEASKRKVTKKLAEVKIRINELESRSSKLIESNTSESINFPWSFSSTSDSRSAKAQGNIASVLPYTQLLTHSKVDSMFRSYIRCLVNRDWQTLEDYAEPLFIKLLKKEVSLLPSKYKMEAENLNTYEAFYDLYEVRNVFMSNANVNRKKADSMHHYYYERCEIDGSPLHSINKKRPSPEDQCGIVLQFYINIYTNLDLKVIDSQGKPVLRDTSIASLGQITDAKPHSMIIELLTCKDRYSSMRSDMYKANQTADIESERIVNHMDAKNMRIVDVDDFMVGNPLVVGLEWTRIQELMPNDTEY